MCVWVQIKTDKSDIDTDRHIKWRQIEMHISLARFIHLCPIPSLSPRPNIFLTSQAFHLLSLCFNPSVSVAKSILRFWEVKCTFSRSFKCKKKCSAACYQVSDHAVWMKRLRKSSMQPSSVGPVGGGQTAMWYIQVGEGGKSSWIILTCQNKDSQNKTVLWKNEQGNMTHSSLVFRRHVGAMVIMVGKREMVRWCRTEVRKKVRRMDGATK